MNITHERNPGVSDSIIPGLDERGMQRGPRWNRAKEERAWRTEVDWLQYWMGEQS